MTLSTSRAAACAAAALVLGLSACGGGTATAPAAPTVDAAAPSAPAATDDDVAGTDDDTAGSDDGNDGDDGDDTDAAKVSANTASEDEIADALETAGVSNPERWAEEVVEYRPYPADDPNLTTLRDNLAKYNPGQETTDKIASALTP